MSVYTGMKYDEIYLINTNNIYFDILHEAGSITGYHEYHEMWSLRFILQNVVEWFDMPP